jgi:hypothetical protein
MSQPAQVSAAHACQSSSSSSRETNDEKWSLDRIAQHLIETHSTCDFTFVSREKMHAALVKELERYINPNSQRIDEEQYIDEEQFAFWAQDVEGILSAQIRNLGWHIKCEPREIILRSLRKVLADYGVEIKNRAQERYERSKCNLLLEGYSAR